MSDRIGVMNRGRIVQQGTPDAIYDTPADLFVTRFIGHSNVMDVTVRRRGPAGLVLDLGSMEIPAPETAGTAVGAAVKLVVRPENILIGETPGGPDAIRMPAVVVSETYQGALVRYRLTIAGQDVVAERQNQIHLERFAAGAPVTVSWDPKRSFTLAA